MGIYNGIHYRAHGHNAIGEEIKENVLYWGTLTTGIYNGIHYRVHGHNAIGEVSKGECIILGNVNHGDI